MRNTLKIPILIAVAAAALAPSPSTASDSKEQMRQTIQVVRETGVRLYAYLRGWTDASGAESPAVEPASEVDWSECGVVGWDELASMIGGDGRAIVDGWGHPLEVCVELDNIATGRHVLGVRSAGADGTFSGPRYEIGPFDETTSPGADVVWMDGYFMRWPQKSAG